MHGCSISTPALYRAASEECWLLNFLNLYPLHYTNDDDALYDTINQLAPYAQHEISGRLRRPPLLLPTTP